jgi:hypothetical protein
MIHLNSVIHEGNATEGFIRSILTVKSHLKQQFTIHNKIALYGISAGKKEIS